MISLSDEAERHVDELIAHYELKGRLEAAEKLLYALQAAKARIEASPETGLPAPRPYPILKRDGLRRINIESYWISYSLTNPPVISGVFYATSDIVGRSR